VSDPNLFRGDLPGAQDFLRAVPGAR